MTAIHRMAELGQSVWYDDISRSMVRNGELQQIVDEGVLGLTSNLTHFETAVSNGADYDAQIRELLWRRPAASARDIIRALMVEDARMAAAVLAPLYARTQGRDGYVSVEVTPSKARDTEATILEARQLWREIGAPNVMIKIPATREGLSAVEQMLSEGVNVNVTLIFAVERYREVAETYCRGLERRLAAGHLVDKVASVASVFVGRIDACADGRLAAGPALDEVDAATLRGQTGVATAKMMYTVFLELLEGRRFTRLQAAGARVQRLLWASTAARNASSPDLLYVETLIGPDTVTAVPPRTYAAVSDLGRPSRTLDTGVSEANAVLSRLAALGIDMNGLAGQLEAEGIAGSKASFDGLEACVEARRRSLLADAPV